jgi:hypothetical protein
MNASQLITGPLGWNEPPPLAMTWATELSRNEDMYDYITNTSRLIIEPLGWNKPPPLAMTWATKLSRNGDMYECFLCNATFRMLARLNQRHWEVHSPTLIQTVALGLQVPVAVSDDYDTFDLPIQFVHQKVLNYMLR